MSHGKPDDRQDASDERVLRKLHEMEEALARLMERVGRLESTRPADPSLPVQEEPTSLPPTPPPLPRAKPEPAEPVQEAVEKPKEPEPAKVTEPVPVEPTPAPVAAPTRSLEVQVGTWWATRIGALLAVICVVFFGVYVSQYSTPLIRFLELLGAAVGMTCLGLWLGRRDERFGGVVFAGGLALIYFASYAAYGIAPVRIIFSETLASWVQFATVVGLVFCGILRRSGPIAAMAIFFGYVACFFSFFAGLNDFALTANLLLAVAAVVFYTSRGWPQPLQVAVPLTYAVFAVLSVFGWFRTHDITFARGMMHLLAYAGIFGVADVLALKRDILMPSTQRKLVHVISSSAAVALGYLFTQTLFPESLPHFYFLFGAVLLAGAAAYYAMNHRDALMHAYFIKGIALVTIGLVCVLGGWTRWIVLAVQSMALLLGAKRSRLWVMHAASSLVWLVSFYYFARTVWASGYLDTPGELWSQDGLVALAYLFFSAGVFVLRGKWMKPTGPRAEEFGFHDAQDLIFSALVGIVALFTSLAFAEPAQVPLLASGLAAGLIGLGFFLRHRVAVLAGLVPLVAAHILLWQQGSEVFLTARILWTDGLAAILAALLAAAYVVRARNARRHLSDASLMGVAEMLLHVLWIATLHVLYFRTFDSNDYLLAGVLTGCAISVVAMVLPFRTLSGLALLPFIIVLVDVFGRWSDLLDLPLAELEPRRWAAFVVVALYARAFTGWARLRDRLDPVLAERIYPWLHAAIVALLGWHALRTTLATAHVVPTAALLGVALLSLNRWRGHLAGVWGSEALPLLGFAWFLYFPFENVEALNAAGLWPFITAAVLTLVHAVAARRLYPRLDARSDAALQWINGALALCMVYILFALRSDALRNFATTLWGTSAIVVFLIGFLDRSKPLRLLGLIGLAVCLPRMFVVDIRSTLYRIAAFGVLGIVLLLVGFLYHTFRDRLERTEDPRA